MKKFFFAFLFLGASLVNSQILLEENFDYGNSSGLLVNVSGGNWVKWAGSNNDFYYSPTSLYYSSYLNSGIGGSAVINAGGEDDLTRTFTFQSSGTVYCSFLVSASYVTTTSNNYNIHFNSSTSQCAKVYFKKGSQSGKYVIGLSKTSDTPVFTNSEYDIGTTYLIVISYKLNPGSKNDEAKLWINPNLDGTEPAADLVKIDSSANDVSSVSSISLRQVTSTIIVDGIRVSTSWSQAPLPVELTSFSAVPFGNKVLLSWATATEVNNYGFELLRFNNTFHANKQWQKVAFIPGNGNSNSPKFYTYVDEPTGGNEFLYKLKQIDYDGSFEYSYEIFVKLELPKQIKLYQNYPNPFNPVTSIKFSIPDNADNSTKKIIIKVFDVLGKEIKTLADDFYYPGNYEIEFDGSKLSAGVYYIMLITENQKFINKCLLIK